MIQDRHTGIQGLRAFCVLAIFFHHVLNSGLPPSSASEAIHQIMKYAEGLRYGVEVFFMISGYVIVQSLQRHDDIISFLKDRFLRIFPLWLPLALCMIFANWFLWLNGGKYPSALSSLPMFIGSLMILSPVFPVASIHPAQWSLNYELIFYVIAATSKFVKNKSSFLYLLWIIPGLVLITLFPRALFFLPGIIIAYSEPMLVRHKNFVRFGWIGLPIAWISWLATDAGPANLGRTLIDFFIENKEADVILAFIGATTFFAWLVTYTRSNQTGLLGNSVIQWLGKISYSFYLIHPIVMAASKRILLPPFQLEGWAATLMFAIISLPLSCVASHFTWKIFEVKFRALIINLTKMKVLQKS